MQPLRYSINVSLDGCVDHAAMSPDEQLHLHAADTLAANDSLLFGRITYTMMEVGWREMAETGVRPDWAAEWTMTFARTIDRMRKLVVSDTLESVDWNADLVRGVDLESTVRALKAQPGRGILTGGVKLPLALAAMGLIDEYQFVVNPRIVGHGPRLMDGLRDAVDLRLVGREEFGSGAVVLRYDAVR